MTRSETPVAWLSPDEGDNDLSRFLVCLVAAWQTVAGGIGQGGLSLLHAPQPQTPPIESILTVLINEIAALPGTGAIELRPHVLVLDDCHVIESQAIDAALTFLLDHLPPNLHLVSAGRASRRAACSPSTCPLAGKAFGNGYSAGHGLGEPRLSRRGGCYGYPKDIS